MDANAAAAVAISVDEVAATSARRIFVFLLLLADMSVSRGVSDDF